MINALTNAQLFHKISALLTGFSEAEIMATGMLESYYNTVLANSDGDDVEYFFLNVEQILYEEEDSRESAIANQLMPNSSYSGLARNITILWYTGNWNNNPVSSAAYIQGLMWDSGYTHPPGAKQPGYGSWANVPISVR